MSVIIPWILTAVRGAIIFAVAVFAIKMLVGGDAISWYLLCFGVPSHVIADFAGFCHVFCGPKQKPALLGNCYFALVVLAIACGFVLGLWAGLLVFVEGWVFGFPGGAWRTVRDLDKTQLVQDLDVLDGLANQGDQWPGTAPDDNE